jgi:hypothetical protein
MSYFNSKIKASVLFFSLASTTLVFFQNCSNKGMFSQASLDQVSNSQKIYTSLFSENDGKVNAFKIQKNDNSMRSMSSSEFSFPLNLGFHMGGVTADNQPFVEEFLFPSQEGSPWYIAQWKKIKPLRPSESLKMTDVNRSLYVLKNPVSDESELSTTIDSEGNYIYNLESKQGYLTSVGGSNIFLSANIRKKNLSNLNREIFFSFDTKLVEKYATVRQAYQGQAQQLLQRDVVGFYIGGFPVQYDDGNPSHRASLFIQFYVADTRINNSSTKPFVYRGFYPHGNYTEIVATIPISTITGKPEDLKLSPDSASAGLTKYKINLNRLLCQSLNGQFVRTDNSSGEQINFSNQYDGLYTKNLKNWSIGSVYLGFETQANFFDEQTHSAEYFYPSSHALYGAHDVRQDIKDRMIQNGEFYKGDVKLRAQIANLEMKAEADPFTDMETCDDVLKEIKKSGPVDEIIQPPPAQVCVPNSTTNSGCAVVANGTSTRTCSSNGSSYGSCSVSCNSGFIDQNGACVQPPPAQVCVPNSTTNSGCAVVANGTSIRTCSSNGLSYGSCSVSCNSGFINQNGSCVLKNPPQEKKCLFGAGVNAADKQAFEWMCNCSSADPIFNKTGWLKQANNCFHRTADSFCNEKRKVYYSCGLQSPPEGSGWSTRFENGCYHIDLGTSCQ